MTLVPHFVSHFVKEWPSSNVSTKCRTKCGIKCSWNAAIQENFAAHFIENFIEIRFSFGTHFLGCSGIQDDQLIYAAKHPKGCVPKAAPFR
jgi:hypothetical protein